MSRMYFLYRVLQHSRSLKKQADVINNYHSIMLAADKSEERHRLERTKKEIEEAVLSDVAT